MLYAHMKNKCEMKLHLEILNSIWFLFYIIDILKVYQYIQSNVPFPGYCHQ